MSSNSHLSPDSRSKNNKLSGWSFRVFGLFALIALVTVVAPLPNVVEFAQKRNDPSAPGKSQKQGTNAPGTSQKDPAQPRAGSQDTKRELSWGADKPADPSVPSYKADTQAYALVVGISAYGNLPQSAQLKFADADARELRDFLVGEKGGFRPENVTLLVNEEANHDQILRELARLQNLSGPDSIALIFFAGHGLVNKSGQAFLVAADTRLDDLLSTGIDMKLFNSTVQSMRSRSAIIISDACHSGALSDLLGQPGSNSVANLSAKAFSEPSGRRDQSSFIFTAASPTQASIERAPLRHGLFTYYMLQGLEGPADSDTDGVVTSSELYTYVSSKIREDSEIAGVKQVPEYNPSFDRSIPLGIVKEEGRAKYRKWFSEDPLVSRWVASFDESLKGNRLTRPEGQSAWDFYLALSNFGPASTTIAVQKRDELLARIRSEADRVIDQFPADSGPWGEARDNLDKAYQLTHDDNFKARQLFATVMYFHTTGETARAERECDNTLTLIEETHANNPLLSAKIGQFYTGLKKWDKARRAYRLVVDKNPTVPWLTEYGQVLMQLGVYADAEENLRRAYTSNPDYQPALISLAQVLLTNPLNERVLEARRLVAHARAVTPDDPDTEELWGRILLATGESKLAIDSLLHVVIRRPAGEKRDLSLLYLSNAFARVGDLDRAISALREAESGGSRNVAVYDALAARLDDQGSVDKTVAVAQKAVDLTKGQAEENGRRVRMMAEYLERSGQLLEAAYKFREASRLTTDGKLSTSLETHARVLFLRSDHASEAGPLASVRSGSDRSNAPRFTSLIIPGGLDALEYLTGVASDEADPVVLARVFDACLRNPAINSRVLSFYEEYPELARKIGLRGSSLSGAVDLPSPTQVASSEAREALKFFGVSDKNGRREIKGEFQGRQHILEALGGDAGKLQRGEPVRIKLQNDELPVLRGMDSWSSLIKDGVKARPEQQFLAFLKDPQAMRMYVGFSVLPDEAIKQFGAQLTMTKDKADTVPASLAFAAPYLRFTPQGELEIPGQRQGEINWQRALRLNNNLPLARALFQRESGGALYLFCALSASGEVGDFMARSAGFEQIFRLVERSSLPSQREPFDLIDFIRLLHVENEQLHLSKAGELWMRSSGGDPVGAVLVKVAGSSPGQEITIVKQLAVLAQIERERPDWATDATLLDLIARQTSANRESELELALDLRMSPRQLTSYYALVTRLDALQTSPAKTSSIRSFQSSFALLRQIAKTSSQPQARLSELIDLLLTLDPLSTDYGPRLVAFVRQDLLNVDEAVAGAELENKLIETLSTGKPVDLPSSPANVSPVSKDGQSADANWQFDLAARKQDQMKKFLGLQKYTHFGPVADAFAALAKLRTNPGAADELAKLKTAVDAFVEPEREPEPKKKKSKQPVVVELTLKEAVARLSIPMSPGALDDVRSRMAPAVGEGLLGYAYAVFVDSMGDVSFSQDLVRKHDFETAPWREAKVDGGRIGGSIGRLSKALARLQARSMGPSDSSAFFAALLGSAQLVDRRLVTRRAEEYVARTMDLGEDVLALSFLADQTASGVIGQMDILTTARRANQIKALMERGEIAKALRLLAPSEFYALGQAYFNQRLGNAAPSKLVDEPGALGAMARVVAQEQGKPAGESSLASEIRQFGMPTTTRTGLSRLDLIEPEPFERSSSFLSDDRLAERLQDLKLATVRRSHRIGGDPMLPVSSPVLRDVTQGVFAEMRKAARGASPPARDWSSLINILQGPNDLTASIMQISKSAFVRTAPRSKWDQR
jgi:tetratricopeptide (TPR) repeat protein